MLLDIPATGSGAGSQTGGREAWLWLRGEFVKRDDAADCLLASLGALEVPCTFLVAPLLYFHAVVRVGDSQISSHVDIKHCQDGRGGASACRRNIEMGLGFWKTAGRGSPCKLPISPAPRKMPSPDVGIPADGCIQRSKGGKDSSPPLLGIRKV